MAVNKVVYGDRTLIDISDSTVNVNNLSYGVISYNKAGNRIVGSLNKDTEVIVTNFSGSVSKISGTANDYLLTISG